MKTKIWKEVVGYESIYVVSNTGDVFSHSLQRNLTQTITPDGYATVSLRKDKKGRKWMVSRVMMAAFVGPIADGYQVNHINGDKLNNNLDNLEYCTQSFNQLHRYRVLGLINNMRGKKHSKESIDKMSLSKMGHITSLSVKQKMCNAKRIGKKPIDIFLITSLRKSGKTFPQIAEIHGDISKRIAKRVCDGNHYLCLTETKN